MSEADFIRNLLHTPAAREVLREVVREEMARAYTSAPNPDEVLTVREVARLKRVSQRTVYGWAARNLIRHERTPGGQLRFPRSEVERFNLSAL